MFEHVAKWLQSLRGEQAEEAARRIVKPASISRRGFLRAIGLTTATVLLGDAVAVRQATSTTYVLSDGWCVKVSGGIEQAKRRFLTNADACFIEHLIGHSGHVEVRTVGKLDMIGRRR